MKLELVIGNKNYSSWSMRPWVLLRQAEIPFQEIQLKFAQDVSVIGVEKYSPTRKVPVLLVDGEPVWDTLAICETAAELFPEKQLWPGKGLTAESQKDINRVVELWIDCRERFGGPGNFLFGRFSIADAFFAPVVMRFHTYGVTVPSLAQAYCEAVQGLAAVREWCDAARRETEFVAADEPYATR
jgi:glutathione S-transferase